MNTVSIKTVLFVIIVFLLITIIVLQFVAISKIKKQKQAKEHQSQDIMNLMMMNVLNNMSGSTKPNINTNVPQTPVPVAYSTCDMDSPQTDFFAKSVSHAEKVLTGKVYLDGYKYGGAMDLTRLDDGTKKSIIIAMKYMMIDPVGARNVEQKYRIIAEQENVPLWFVILHESIKKLIPIENNPSVSQISNEALLAEVRRREAAKEKAENKETEGGKVVSINQVA